jgi:hypothetical protein
MKRVVSRIAPWLAGGTVGVALLVVAMFLAKPTDHFRKKYDQIRPEMTRAEVVKILGPPDEVMHPGGSLGGTIYYWWDGAGRMIIVEWPLAVSTPYNEKKLIK